MLDELEERISTVERTIYDWVCENFGEGEANDPSWDIAELAGAINKIEVSSGEQYITLGSYLAGE